MLFSIISELNKEFPAIWLVQRSLIWRCSNRARRWFLSLITKLITFVISVSKHGGHFLNEFSKDITPSPRYLKGWRILKMTAFGTKTPFKDSYSRHFKRMELRLHTCMQTNKGVCVFMLSPLFSVAQLWKLWQSAGGPRAAKRNSCPYRKAKETHELIFSRLSWLAVLLVGAYARRRRRSCATWRP